MVSLLCLIEWFTEFCYGCTSTNDFEGQGYPNEVTTELSNFIVNKINDIVLDDHWIKIHKIAKKNLKWKYFQFGYEKVNGKMSDAFSHSWPKKMESHIYFKTVFGHIKCNPSEFQRHFVTIDNTCIHYTAFQK